jgi:hypothetical protein
MTIKPRWENTDQTEEYNSYANSIIRFEAMHAIISEYSNFEINAYGQASNYWQEILPLLEFMPKFDRSLRQRYGEAVWDEIIQLAISFQEHMNKAKAFFEPVPEDLTIHQIGRTSAQSIAAEVFHQGLWYRACGLSQLEIRTADEQLVKREEFPDEVWIDQVWLVDGQVYIPCKSYCLPTVLVRYDKGLAARSGIGHWMDPLPVGFWRELKVPMS